MYGILRNTVVIIFLILLLSSFAHAQDSLHISTEAIMFNHWGMVRGYCRIDDSTAFVSVKNHGLALMRFDENNGISEIGTFFIYDDFARLIKHGNIVYSIKNQENIAILDFSDPLSPVIVNEIEVEGYIEYIKFKNGYLTALSMYGGGSGIFHWTTYCVEIFSIENPTEPELIGRAEHTHGDCMDPLIDYAITDSEIYFLTYETRQRGPLEIDASMNEDIFLDEFDHYITGINYTNGFLYASGDSTLATFDIRDPEEIIRTSELQLPEMGANLEDEGDELLVYGGEYWWWWATDELMPARRYDISDPAHPVESFSQPYLYNYYAAEIENDILIGSPESHGFQMIDVENPYHPQIIAEFHDEGEVRKIIVANGWGFLEHSNYDNLLRVDFSDLSQPVFEEFPIQLEEPLYYYTGHRENIYAQSSHSITRYQIDDDGEIDNITSYEVESPDSIIYFKLYNNLIAIRTIDEIQIIEANDDGSFTFLSRINSDPGLFDFSDYLLCIKTGIDEMTIYSIYNPLNPSVIDTYYVVDNTTEYVGLADFQVIGSRIVYRKAIGVEIEPGEFGTVYEVEGLRYINGSLTPYGNFAYYDNADMYSDGNMLLLNSYNRYSNENSRTAMYNILDYSHPRKIGEYISPYGFKDVAIGGNILMLGNADRFLQVFNAEQVIELDVNDEISVIPTKFALHNPYPNPFNPSVNLSFTIDRAGLVDLSVYNILGQHIATLIHENYVAGDHKYYWNSQDQQLGSGTYFITLKQENKVLTQKVMLLK